MGTGVCRANSVTNLRVGPRDGKYQGYVLQGLWIPGKGMGVLQNLQKFRVLWHGRTELTEVPGGYKRCCTRTPGIVARGVQNYIPCVAFLGFLRPPKRGSE